MGRRPTTRSTRSRRTAGRPRRPWSARSASRAWRSPTWSRFSSPGTSTIPATARSSPPWSPCSSGRADRLPHDRRRTGAPGTYESAGGMLYLSELNLATPSAAHLEFYAGIVLEHAVRRRYIDASQQVAELAWNERSARAVHPARCRQYRSPFATPGEVTFDTRPTDPVLQRRDPRHRRAEPRESPAAAGGCAGRAGGGVPRDEGTSCS